MEEVCENCKYRSDPCKDGVCIYWVVNVHSNEWFVASTLVEPGTDPGYLYPATPATFSCNAWKEKVTGPFRIKGQGVQFFDGKFWAESAWSSENLEGWLNRMWAWHKGPAIRFDVKLIDKGVHYQPVIQIGKSKRFLSIGSYFFCEDNARRWIEQLKEVYESFE